MDNLADHMEAVLDTGRDIRNSLAVVADNQVAVEDSQDILGNQQVAVAVAADNSCKGCNLLATVEQWDTACWLELLDMVPTVLYCTHKTCTHTTHVREPGMLIILVKTMVDITILWQRVLPIPIPILLLKSTASTNTSTFVTILVTVYYIQQCSLLFINKVNKIVLSRKWQNHYSLQ